MCASGFSTSKSHFDGYLVSDHVLRNFISTSNQKGADNHQEDAPPSLKKPTIFWHSQIVDEEDLDTSSSTMASNCSHQQHITEAEHE